MKDIALAIFMATLIFSLAKISDNTFKVALASCMTTHTREVCEHELR